MFSRLLVAVLLVAVSGPFVLAEEASEEWIIPIVAAGSSDSSTHLQTTIRLIALTTTAAQGAIAVLDDSGQLRSPFCPGPVEVPPAETQFDLPGQGNQELRLATGLGLLTGWARIRADRADLLQAAAEIALVAKPPIPCPPLKCNQPSTEFTSSLQVEAVLASRSWKGQAILTEQRQTALAIVNPSSTETIDVELSLFDQTGRSPNNACPARITLGPGKRIADFAWNLFSNFRRPTVPVLSLCELAPGAPPDMFHGSFQVSSTSPVAVGALHLLLPEGKMVNLPLRRQD